MPVTLKQLWTYPASILIAALILLSGMTVYRFTNSLIFFDSDTQTYLQTAALFRGQDTEVHPERLLKPLAPAGIAFIAGLFGTDLPTAFLVEVLLAYFILGFVTFGFYRELFALHPNRDRLALAGTLLLVCGYPILKYGLQLYTETGAVAFVVGVYWLIARYVHKPSRWTLFAAAFVGGIGFLWKEYAIVGLLALGLAVLFLPRTAGRVKGILIEWAIIATTASLIIVPWLLFVWNNYHYSYFDWLHIGRISGQAVLPANEKLFIAVKSLFAIALLGWAPALWALYRRPGEYRNAWRILALIGVPCALFLFWGSASSRLYYVLAPVIFGLAVMGENAMIGGKVRPFWALIILVLLGNIIWLFTSEIVRPLYSAWET